jgi:flagellin FlaB
MYKKYFKNEKGITGLETAIILIAFVVVAAVFAYTALSAGLFSTQKAQEAIYSGLQEARSTLELRGPVIATGNGTGGTVKQISFVVGNVLGGDPIDFTEPAQSNDNDGTANSTTSNNKVVLKYIDANQTVNDLYWTCDALGLTDGDDILDPNEKIQVTVGSTSNGTAGGNLIDALANDLGPNTTFTLEVLTPAGAILQIERTTPARIELKMNLH